ncbi:MAG: cardiolipin synthase [Bacteroidota bacterium]
MEYLYNLKYYVIIAYYVFVSVLIIAIILDNKKPGKAFAYIFLLLLFPLGGVLLYFLFGVHYQKRKLFSRYRNYQYNNLQKGKVDKETEPESPLFLDENKKLLTLFKSIDNACFTSKNEVKVLKNGEGKFPVLKEELNKAEKKIHMEYYIIDDDVIGLEIINVLCEKAGEGIKVKLIYDDVGSSISKKSKQKLKEAGVEFKPYMPVFFSRFAHKANYRDHRKIVVIDDKVGFLGGINVSDKYINSEKSQLYWRDTHVMIKGEAVIGLQMLFIDNWFFVSGKRLKLNRQVDFSDINSSTSTAILGSDYGDTYHNLMEAFFAMITCAQEEILITTPYFLPNDSILDAIKVASKGGVKVKLLIPRKPDLKTAYYASQSYLLELLTCGVEVYYYTKGMLHAKTMVIDSNLSTVGSANMDQRSFDLNAEVNAFMMDKTTAITLKKQFEADIKDAFRVRIKDMEQRKWQTKILSSLARLFAPVL